MDKEMKKELQTIKSRLRVLLKEFEILASVKINFNTGDIITIENETYLITLDSKNEFAVRKK